MPANRDNLLDSLRAEIKGIESGSNLTFEDPSEPQGSSGLPEKNARCKLPPSAFNRIESWCSRKFRSERDVRSRLRREGFEDQEIDDAVDRAKRCLLIDDDRFADVLIRSCIRSGKGQSGIAFKLKQEGINPESVEGWPEDYIDNSFESELDRALKLLNSKPPRSKNLQASAYRKLITKGYSSAVASRAAREFCEKSL